MNVSASLPARFAHRPALSTVGVALGIVLLLSGCAAGSWKPRMSLKDLRLPENSEDFRKRFYAGFGLGMTQLKPDAQPPFSADTSSSSGSQIQLGYDLNNRIALEFQSSVLGQAELDTVDTTPVKYSGYSGSALIYALSGSENRNRRQRWSGFGRLGLAANRQGSNVEPLNGSSTDLLLGAGVEYGFSNGVGLRGEVIRYNSDATFVGLGAVYRFDSFKEFVPQPARMAKKAPVVASRFNTPRVSDRAGAVAAVPAGQDMVGMAVPTQAAIGTVRVLASATDHDVDGVPNKQDRCEDTASGVPVDDAGCGLFDGTLANSTFTNGSAKLEPNVKASLDNLVLRLLLFPEIRIAIEGHTDGKGHEDINLNVSRTRANMVRNYLIRQGVPAWQLETRAYGETRPVASNQTEQGRDLNRRIEFVTLPSLTQTELAKAQSGPVKVSGTKKARPASAKKTLAEMAESLNPKFAAATAGIDLLPATRLVPGLRVSHLMKKVTFEAKSSNLTPASSQPLQEVARVLQRFPSVKLMLAAHTTSLDDADENLKLSQQQASVVATALVKSGVNRRRLVTRGFGDTLPLFQVVSDADRSLNQRVELRPLKN